MCRRRGCFSLHDVNRYRSEKLCRSSYGFFEFSVRNLMRTLSSPADEKVLLVVMRFKGCCTESILGIGVEF